jgi:hypothetical protein
LITPLVSSNSSKWILNDVKKNVNFIQFKYNILNIIHWNGVGYWFFNWIDSVYTSHPYQNCNCSCLNVFRQV